MSRREWNRGRMGAFGNLGQYSSRVVEMAEASLEECLSQQAAYEGIRRVNIARVLAAFKSAGLSDYQFGGTTGYGYNDAGRQAIEAAFSVIAGSEASLVRHQIVSGTHAISLALFGVLRPGGKLLAAFGKPYDTLDGIIGGKEGHGSLAELGIGYIQVEPASDGEPDYDAISTAVKSADAVLVQRSRGYSTRKPLSIGEIGRICEVVGSSNPEAVVIVDNCYGEFTDTQEPTAAGAHLIAGSLIKNPGGGIAPAGGYVAGRADLVEKAASRLTAPGLGSHCGPTLGMNRLIAQGLYFAPMITCEAMCASAFASCFLARLGFKTDPGPRQGRGDSVVRVELGNKEALLSFMKAVQGGSPVDAKATPEPGFMPGYSDDVVMAAGAFIQGSSIELSADAPMRPPFTAYMQGGLSRHQMETTLMGFAEMVIGRG